MGKYNSEYIKYRINTCYTSISSVGLAPIILLTSSAKSIAW